MSEIKNKGKKIIEPIPTLSLFLKIIIYVAAACIVCTALALFAFEKRFENRIYPNVTEEGVPFGGKTKNDVINYWNAKNRSFATAQFELKFQSTIATISASDIDLGYDAELSATQAYLVGRSKGVFSNLFVKFFRKQVDLAPYFRWKTGVVDDVLRNVSEQIDIPAEDALFRFANNKVIEFKPSKDGRKLNIEATKLQLQHAFTAAAKTNQQRITILLPVETVHPLIVTSSVNSFGIRELIGRGYSEFAGSIPGRIHNVALAASRLNGVLIKPGETFSFNDAVGDISAATGYQSAYIIKEGRTVLGDGGGVCQVSSTLFRAALDVGLPIVERHAHAYRVHYYEEGGYKPGLDATVFSPSVDLKFKNDTPNYILIQTKTDTENLTLTFELYGTRDGRTSQVYNEKLWGQSPPPPDLYQDDPTLPKGTIKQVDFAAWGAKASFQYRVTRGNQVLEDTTFYSNFQPWQAVYLRGTQ
jgi:vancomycin resistance protein YoaR